MWWWCGQLMSNRRYNSWVLPLFPTEITGLHHFICSGSHQVSVFETSTALSDVVETGWHVAELLEEGRMDSQTGVVSFGKWVLKISCKQRRLSSFVLTLSVYFTQQEVPASFILACRQSHLSRPILTWPNSSLSHEWMNQKLHLVSALLAAHKRIKMFPKKSIMQIVCQVLNFFQRPFLQNFKTKLKMKITSGDFSGSLRETGLCQVAKALVWVSGDLSPLPSSLQELLHDLRKQFAFFFIFSLRVCPSTSHKLFSLWGGGWH